MIEVGEALVTFELGGIISPPPNFNVKDVYELTNRSIPVVCVLPAAMTPEMTVPQLESIKGSKTRRCLRCTNCMDDDYDIF